MDLIEKAYPGDEDLYVKVKQPVYIDRNLYLDGAESYKKEVHAFKGSGMLKIKITKANKEVYLEAEVSPDILKQEAAVMTTADLGTTRAVEGLFENPDGTAITFDTDYCGEKRTWRLDR